MPGLPELPIVSTQVDTPGGDYNKTVSQTHRGHDDLDKPLKGIKPAGSIIAYREATPE